MKIHMHLYANGPNESRGHRNYRDTLMAGHIMKFMQNTERHKMASAPPYSEHATVEPLSKVQVPASYVQVR